MSNSLFKKGMLASSIALILSGSLSAAAIAQDAQLAQEEIEVR